MLRPPRVAHRTVPLNIPDNPPKDSWWARPMSRDEFDDLARAECDRMRLSKLGQLNSVTIPEFK